MPQVVVLVLGLCSLYFAYRWVCRDIARVERSLGRMERRACKLMATPVTQLKKDPITGVYRLSD